MKESNSSKLLAGYWMLVTLSLFSLTAVSVKELTEHLNTTEIIFYRSLVSLIVIIPIVIFFGFKKIITQDIGKHFTRNTAHFFGQYGWIYGISLIPLAEVFALEFTVPIWTAIIASILLKERLTKIRSFAIALGFIGVLIILRPGLEIIQLASFAVLLGAMSYALSHTLTKSLVQKDTPLSIIFFMALFQLPMALILSFNNLVVPSGIMWVWIIIAGVTAMLAHYCMSKALTYADAMVVVPMDFLRLPLIMIVGFIIYNENIEWLILVGALVMLVGNFIGLKYDNKLRS